MLKSPHICNSKVCHDIFSSRCWPTSTPWLLLKSYTPSITSPVSPLSILSDGNHPGTTSQQSLLPQSQCKQLLPVSVPHYSLTAVHSTRGLGAVLSICKQCNLWGDVQPLCSHENIYRTYIVGVVTLSIHKVQHPPESSRKQMITSSCHSATIPLMKRCSELI